MLPVSNSFLCRECFLGLDAAVVGLLIDDGRKVQLFLLERVHTFEVVEELMRILFCHFEWFGWVSFARPIGRGKSSWSGYILSRWWKSQCAFCSAVLSVLGGLLARSIGMGSLKSWPFVAKPQTGGIFC